MFDLDTAPLQPLLKKSDILRLFDWKPSDLIREVANGTIHPIKLGASVRYHPSDLEKISPDIIDMTSPPLRFLRLMDADDVAEIFSISPEMVGKITRSGLLPRIQIGRAVRYDPADVASLYERLVRYRSMAI